jgi:hypothetical protein
MTFEAYEYFTGLQNSMNFKNSIEFFDSLKDFVERKIKEYYDSKKS